MRYNLLITKYLMSLWTEGALQNWLNVGVLMVVVGGLITSTALTILLLQLIYEWAELREERRKQPQPVPAIEGATT